MTRTYLYRTRTSRAADETTNLVLYSLGTYPYIFYSECKYACLQKAMTVKNIEQLLELQAIDKLLFDLQRDTQQPTPHDDSAPLLCSNLVVAEAQRCDLYHKRDIVTHSIDPKIP